MRTADKPLVPYTLGISLDPNANTPAASGEATVGGGRSSTLSSALARAALEGPPRGLGLGLGSRDDQAVVAVSTPVSTASLPVRQLEFAAQLQSGVQRPIWKLGSNERHYDIYVGDVSI